MDPERIAVRPGPALALESERKGATASPLPRGEGDEEPLLKRFSSGETLCLESTPASEFYRRVDSPSGQLGERAQPLSPSGEGMARVIPARLQSRSSAVPGNDRHPLPSRVLKEMGEGDRRMAGKQT